MGPPASQCCRALQRPIIPSRDAVWITDSVLASAFERYCPVSRTWNRKIGNVPGPLESQRRLGRRRMGDALMLHCPPTPASWAFSAPLNFSKWTWEPPSLGPSVSAPLERNRLPHDDTGDGWLATLPHWLKAPIPYGDGEQTEVFPGGLTDTSLADVAATQNDPPLAAKIEAFRWAATYDTTENLAYLAEEISHNFQQLIVLGELSPEDALPPLAEVLSALDLRLQETSLGHRLSLSLCRAILTGLTTSRVTSPSLLDAQFWNTFLAQISILRADDKLCDLFVDVMKAMPEAHLHQVSDGILCVLKVFLENWSCSKRGPNAAEISRLLDINMLGREARQGKQVHSALSANLRHAKGIARALQAVDRYKPEGFLDAAKRLVLDQAAASTTGRSMLRYTWLHVLAQMPRVRSNLMFDTAAALCDPSLKTAPMSHLELCSLLLTQWNSRRRYYQSPRDLYRTYKQHCQNHEDAALSSLFVAIFRQMPRALQFPLYSSSWKLLAKLNRTDDVLSSLSSDAKTNKLPVEVLQDLAYTSNNHNIAIRLHDLWTRQLKSRSGSDWHPVVFLKYAEQIVLDPRIPPKTIWRVLDIKQFHTREKDLWAKTRAHRYGTYGERRAEVVEKATAAFAMAPHLPNRVAFRHVSQGFQFIKAIRGHVPFSVIWNIYQVVSRDLMERRPGRTKRLLWFVKVVQEHYGFEVAWKCRLILRLWRSRLTKVWISMGGNGTG